MSKLVKDSATARLNILSTSVENRAETLIRDTLVKMNMGHNVKELYATHEGNSVYVTLDFYRAYPGTSVVKIKKALENLFNTTAQFDLDGISAGNRSCLLTLRVLHEESKSEFDESVMEKKSAHIKQLRAQKEREQERLKKAEGDKKGPIKKTVERLAEQIKKLVHADAETAVELVNPLKGSTDALEDAEKAADYLQTELVKLFPKSKYIVRARVKQILGPVFSVDVLNVPESEANDRLKLANATTSISMMMHMSTAHKIFTLEDGPFTIDLNKSMGKPKQAGVKWRKISGKTPMEVAKKTLLWFKKYAELIDSVYDARW